MTIHQAKAIPMDELLHQLGYQPERERSGRKWYRYRQEKTASFVLSKDAHAWFDHGSGQGGNIIDFALMEGNCTSVSDALSWLEQATNQGAYAVQPAHQRLPVISEPPAYSVEAVSQLHDTRGIHWLGTRGIDYTPVQPYLKDVHFNKIEKPARQSFYGIGLENRAGGYEVRSKLDGTAWQKTSVGPKDITVFNLNPKGPWFTFEGLPDFCTFLTLDKPPYGTFNFLILNGTGLTGKAIEYLAQQKPTSLIVCSQAGEGAKKSKKALVTWSADKGWAGGEIDYRWEGFEDYNAKLMHDKAFQTVANSSQSKRTLKSTPKLDLR